MNIHELHYVLCIAKHQNITKAAHELYISQPTLSKYLKKLERELGVKLFSRVDNCYLPTHAGRRYLDYASKVLALTNDWNRELADLVSDNAGELNVAFPLMRSSCMLPHILPEFHRLHPGVRLNFYEETYGLPKCLLEDSTIDFAIFSECSPHPKLTYETLGREELLLAASPSHPIAAGLPNFLHAHGAYPALDWTLLNGEKLILQFPEQNTGAITARLLEKYHINSTVPFYTRNTQAALLLAQENQGLCFAPETYVYNTRFHTPPVCFSLKDEDAFITTMLAYRKGLYLSSYALDFIEIARAYFQRPFSLSD